MLYQLSYAGFRLEQGGLERETKIELATNSLEGCDSTIELLPLACLRSTDFNHCTESGMRRSIFRMPSARHGLLLRHFENEVRKLFPVLHQQLVRHLRRNASDIA